MYILLVALLTTQNKFVLVYAYHDFTHLFVVQISYLLLLKVYILALLFSYSAALFCTCIAFLAILIMVSFFAAFSYKFCATVYVVKYHCVWPSCVVAQSSDLQLFVNPQSS